MPHRKTHKMHHPPTEKRFEPYIDAASRRRRLIIFRHYVRTYGEPRMIPKAERESLKEKLRDPSRATGWVKAFSRKMFGVKGTTTERDILRIMNWFERNIQYVNEKPSVIEPLYARQTAEDILQTGKISTIVYRGLPAWGCAALSDTFIALLKTMPRVKNIKHVRTVTGRGPHTVVYFELPGSTPATAKRFVADPFFHGMLFFGGDARNPVMVQQVGLELGKRIEDLKARGKWKEYKNVRDYNRTWMDYWKET